MSTRAYFFKKTFDCFMVGIFVIMLLFLWMLYKGPISVPYLKPYIIQALNYDENEYAIDVGSVNIELVRSIQPLRVMATDISLQKKDDSINIDAPKLYMSFSLRALLKGIVAPSDVSLINPRATIYASYGVDDAQQNSIGRKKLQFYVEQINTFLSNYNSPEKIYPESYVNNITIKNGELEFYEVDFDRRWVLSDLNIDFYRHFVNLEVNASALINLNDKIASIGFESEYHAADDKLETEIYFYDMVLADLMGSLNETTEENIFSVMSIDVPVNGKISAAINLRDILQNPSEAGEYIDGAFDKIDFEIDGGAGIITFEGDTKYDYKIDGMQLAGTVSGGLDSININNAVFKMGGQTANLDFTAEGLQNYYLEHSLKDTAVHLEVNVPSFPLSELSLFWPRYIAESAWEWCKDGLSGGKVENADFSFYFGYNNKNNTWGLLDFHGTAQLTDGDLFYLEGMPPVHNVYGTAHFTDHNILIDIDKGNSDGVLINGGSVDIYDLNREDNFISIKLVGNSELTAVLKLIDNPPLRFTSDMGLNPDKVKGSVDMKLNLDFELRQDLDSKDIKVEVKADLHDLEMKDFIPHHLLSAEQMKLKVNNGGWQLDGKGMFDDIPVDLALNEKFSAKNDYTRCKLSFKLDEAAKKTLGIDWEIVGSPYIEGFALVDADVIINRNDTLNIDIRADLQNTKIDYSLLGFIKDSNQPADIKAHVITEKGRIKSISSINLTKPDFRLDGNVAMYPSGRVKNVDISKIEGPKTAASAKINLSDRDSPNIKVEVSGNSYNLMPLFDKKADDNKVDVSDKSLYKNEDDDLEDVHNTDIFIAVNSLWTNEGTPIQNFTGNAKLRRGIGIEELNMAGNYGIDKSIKLNLSYIPRGDKEHYLSIESNNAGSTLKVLRLYDNMVGGNLKIEARRTKDKKFIGHAMIRDFSIQNAPVMAQLLSVGSFTGMLDLLRGDGLMFTHFSAPFEYQYKVLRLKHAKAEGNVVGITLLGTYNRALDVIDLKGVIAPAYSLNRFLGKIPVVGNLLASKDGTIFAANYKIDGTVDEPEIDINSLSILSPNSMKEWYDENFGENID